LAAFEDPEWLRATGFRSKRLSFSMDGPDGPLLKIVVVGNSGCGKTAIITRWALNIFSQSTKPTIGSNHERKRVILSDGTSVNLCVWDTAGQEQFYSLVPLYARSAALGIVVAAVNDPASFESIPVWIKAIDAASSPPPPMLLAVNKMDLYDGQQKVIENIHSAWDASFASIFFVSALTGESVCDLFDNAAWEASRFASSITQPASTATRPGKQQSGCC
jgi:small GTP-binding protein